jgi:glycosyltransferase involved in cell wall biosynthesis
MKRAKTSAGKPLIIDCQIFQTYSSQRGMGKYSLELIRALIAEQPEQISSMHFVFTTKKKIDPEIKKQLKDFAPDAEFVELDLDLPKEPREEFSVEPVRHRNKALLNSYIDEQFADEKPRFLILSVYLDEVCSVFPDRLDDNAKLLLYYDSIPYLYHQRYGQFKNFFDHFYLPHTATVFEADKVFTISKTVANDLRLYFGIIREKIVAIDGAPIPRAVDKPVKPKNWKAPADGFVLMPTGQEIRKNNPRAVQAFEKFARETGKDYKLVITSHFNEDGRKDLEQYSDRLIFTGNVPENELIWLYQNCRFVFFASEYEGLGLPVLEAVDENKYIACSDISVFREMSQDAFHFFDPLDTDDIATTLQELDQLVDNGVPNAAASAYQKVAEHYTWPQTAKAFLAGLTPPEGMPAVKKPKIAILGPDPSGFSEIGKVIGSLHAWYSQFFEIEYYFDRGPNHHELRPNILKYVAPNHRATDFKASDYERFDAVIYHIGNSEYHRNIIRAALVFPGYMMLHDTDLNGLYHNLLKDEYMTQQRFDAEGRLDKILGTKKPAGKNSRFISSLINNQKAVIVHSKYAKEAVEAKLVRDVPVAYFELPFDTPIYPDISNRFDSHRKPTIAFAGIIAKVKGIDLMEDIALSPEFADCQINIFGFSTSLTEQLKKLRTLPNVNIVLNATDFEFQQLLAKSDVLVNVRLAYRGETSASTLSHMRYGGIALVRDFGWFGELPDDAVVKVERPEDTLEALQKVMANPANRQKLHAAALAYMQAQHSLRAYAENTHRLIISD